MPERRTIFVSCGQYTKEERELGKGVCELIDESTPFKGYFAQNQTTLQALSENVLRWLYESVGLVVIMHHRGKVEGRDLIRASVWIEQEIAIATMMEQILHRPLRVALFIQRGIAIEGIRQQLQLNAVEFNTGDEVIARLREVLRTWTEPLYVGDEEVEKLVHSVDLSIAAQSGNNFTFTIEVENHSTVDVEVRSIVLWSMGSRVCKPVSPPNGVRWLVPATRNIPIQFTAREDVVLRLARIYGESPVVGNFPRTFRAEIKIELRCKIQGVDRVFEEMSTVQVDYRNRQITGL